MRAEKGIGEEEAVSQVKTFSYPSTEKCETARANKKGCPVFYVADNPGTALKEAGCEKGDIVYVSKWQVTSAYKARFFLFFDHPLPPQHNWEKVRAQQDKQFNQSLGDTPEEIKEKWHQLHKAYCKAFLGDDYQISSLIGHEMLHASKKPEIDIVVYPSTIEGDHSCNLAIHPDFADKNLQMIKVWKLKVTDENFDQKPELMKTGDIKDEEISWHKPTAQEQKEMPV